MRNISGFITMNRIYQVFISVLLFSFIILGVLSCSNVKPADKNNQTTNIEIDSTVKKDEITTTTKTVDKTIQTKATVVAKKQKKSKSISKNKKEGKTTVIKTKPTDNSNSKEVKSTTEVLPITQSIKATAINPDSSKTIEKVTSPVNQVLKSNQTTTNTAKTIKGKKISSKAKNLDKKVPTIVKDADSNSYSIIVIGKQSWMGENLKTTHYANGKSIPNVKDSTRWAVFNSGAYCAYKNDTTFVKTHGLLYNWNAVNDSQKICPRGWHVPTDADWSVLIENLGGISVAGGKMKDTSSLWINAYGNTNESGFNGIPSGCRTNKGTFNSFGFYGLWWSSSENYSNYAWYRCVNYNSVDVFRHYYYKRYGFSVRCLKN